jgi:hypothetical protein
MAKEGQLMICDHCLYEPCICTASTKARLAQPAPTPEGKFQNAKDFATGYFTGDASQYGDEIAFAESYVEHVTSSLRSELAAAQQELKAVHLALENVSDTPLEAAKWIVADYKSLNGKLRVMVDKYKLGLGGEHLVDLVCAAYEQAESSLGEAREALRDVWSIRDFQKRMTDWGIRCFGEEHIFDSKVRALRLVEEAVEFAQAVDAPQDQCAKLIEYVYSRPKGNPDQELGGVGVTVLVAASSRRKDFLSLVEAEVKRVESKPTEHFTQRNRAKLEAGFDGTSAAPAHKEGQ